MAPATQPRAIGRLDLSVRQIGPGGRSGLDGLRPSGCLKALFPRMADPARGVEAVMINTSGGITGGDRLTVRAEAGAGARLRLTTQAAERAYAAQPGSHGRVTTRLHAAKRARLDWLPQEMILYNRSALRRSLRIEMAGDASVLLVEPVVFGRAAMGERVSDLSLRDRIEIWRDGALVYLDAVALDGDAEAQLARRAVAAGAGAMACVVLAAPGAGAHLDAVRALLPQGGGVSLIRDGLLAARLLARDAHALRATLIPVLSRLSDAPLPRSWMT